MTQPLSALALANKRRMDRAERRADVAAGRLTLAALLEDPPAELNTLKIVDALQWQHRWGRTRALRFLAQLQYRGFQMAISESRQIGELTQRQRSEIAAALRAIDAGVSKAA